MNFINVLLMESFRLCPSGTGLCGGVARYPRLAAPSHFLPQCTRLREDRGRTEARAVAPPRHSRYSWPRDRVRDGTVRRRDPNVVVGAGVGRVSRLDLSVIIPLYNEEDSIELLFQAVMEAVEPLDLAFEIVFVDDGSRDRTFEFAKRLASRDQRVRVIKFRRNYGQTPAMVAGIQYAHGHVLVTMDGDLQNDPADISQLLEKIEEGYDIVVGWRRRRQDKLLTRVLPSKAANWLIAKVTGVPIKDNGCSLKAYRANLIKQIPLYSEMHRFIPAMTSLAGARIAQIPVRHHPRRYGVSKYGLSRVYKVFFDLLAIKSVLILAAHPLFSFTRAAVLAAFVSAILILIVLAQAIASSQPIYIVLPTLSMLFGALALFLVSLGLLAQLVYRTGGLKTKDFSALTARVVQGENEISTKSP